MKVICISGKAQHGKDTVAQEIKRQLEGRCEYPERVLITHYADLVKYICEKFFQWNGEKDEYGRTLLQLVGTDIVRKQQPDYWVNFIVDVLKFFGKNGNKNGMFDYVLIPDCRFPNEIDRMKLEFDTISVRVVRYDDVELDKPFENSLTEDQRRHPSETSLDAYDFDSYINNPGTKGGLEYAVSKWIKENLDDEQD